MKRVPLASAVAEGEAKLFSFILGAAKGLDVTLRVAGGWVRDHMINQPSKDIDIAIETASGRPVVSGEQLAHVMSRATQLDKHPTVTVVKANPEKSKHIETGMVKVMGYELEFCHLRRDDYSVCTDTQRTPGVTVATPLEDAQRRDFCCNALYYNLHTGEVEDFVGGLEDLQRRLLRCPLAPLETFHDDPLRMLRGVRFAGKLGFALDESITRCVTSE